MQHFLRPEPPQNGEKLQPQFRPDAVPYPADALAPILADPPGPFFARLPTARPTPRRASTRRRALELLASCPDGVTDSVLLAHGFTVEQLVELVRAGLATATTERVVMGPRTIEVARVRITEAGRQALGGRSLLLVDIHPRRARMRGHFKKKSLSAMAEARGFQSTLSQEAAPCQCSIRASACACSRPSPKSPAGDGRRRSRLRPRLDLRRQRPRPIRHPHRCREAPPPHR